MNPIEYLQSKGFKISSDPSTYASGIWGLRNYTQYDPIKKYWINHDSYSDGYHNAYDLYREDGAPLPAVVDGTIVDGTRQNGNFGGTIVLADNKGDYQYIYGHCKNLRVKVGDKVKQGDILGYQSNTNYAGVYMDSHLHFQTQKQQYYANEKTFVKTGINPLGIDVNNYVGKTPSKPVTNTSTSGTHTVKKGETLYSISRKYDMAVDELMKINGLKNHVIHPGDKLKTKKSVAVTPPKKPATSKPKTPRTIGSWQANQINGAQYVRAEGTFTVGSKPIMSRFDNPSINNNNEGGWAQPGDKYKYQYLVRANGYVWIQYELNGRQKFLPYNTWNSKTGKVGKNEWGSFS